ncbi:o-succinylbenzoate synthase [Prochlorothrix hollandica]|uniref:o-succinylbenzoate synthase n=1 Tax=Prochlorothrix hollandica TaxID=1223 RepID=UPI00333FE0EE
MDVQFDYRHYSRRFQTALFTPLGVWSSRLGMVVRLQQGDRVVYGDISPIPWFACESFDEVFQFCSRWPKTLTGGVTAAAIVAIPESLPATRFGIGWAWEQLQRPTLDPDPGGWSSDQNHLDYDPPLVQSALLPAGPQALAVWGDLWDQGYRTFKVKVGDRPLPRDLDLIQQLRQALPAAAQLRLDANGKLTEAEARQLLEWCDRLGTIEFVEQPTGDGTGLPPGVQDYREHPDPAELAEAKETAWILLQTLAQDYQTPIALDESVTTVAQVRQAYDRGWRGVVVLKPSLAGSPQAVRDLFTLADLDLVLSSAFETAIGRQAVLSLAQDWEAHCSPSPRAAGLGVSQWLQADGLDSATAAEVWKFIHF